MPARDFWMAKILALAELDGERLTLKVEDDGQVDFNALVIQFRDRTTCTLIGEEQEDAEAKYDYSPGRCTHATLTSDALAWQEEKMSKCWPRDRDTGELIDGEERISAFRTTSIVRLLDDIVGIETVSIFEMNFHTFDDGDDD